MLSNSYSTQTQLSFMQWLDNRILQNGQGYFNTSSRLYYQADPRLGPDYVCYASPFRSWVWDSGVSGAIIGGQVSGSLGLGGTGAINPGQSGMVVDFLNGRVIFPASVGTSAIISGSYAVKELNLYTANESAERMVFTNKYYLNSRFARPITGIPPAYEMVMPCMFVSTTRSDNEPWALGGLYNTEQHLSIFVMAETLSQLEGVLQLMIDSRDLCLPLLPPSAWPLNESGFWKGGTGYNWETVKAQYAGQPYLQISEATATKLGDGVKIDQNVFLGAVDVTVFRPRTIH